MGWTHLKLSTLKIKNQRFKILMAAVKSKKDCFVAAAVVAEKLPEFFANRFDVLRMAKRRVIPCYVLPGTGRTRSGEFRFSVAEVRKAMQGYFQPAL